MKKVFGYGNVEKNDNGYCHYGCGYQREIVSNHYELVKDKFKDSEYELSIITAFCDESLSYEENVKNSCKLFRSIRKHLCKSDIFIYKVFGRLKNTGDDIYGFLCVTKKDDNFSNTFVNNEIQYNFLNEDNFVIYGLECPGNIPSMQMYSSVKMCYWRY